MAKNMLSLICTCLVQSYATKLFLKSCLHQSLDIMVSDHHVQYQKKLMIQSLENLVTDRWINQGTTDRQVQKRIYRDGCKIWLRIRNSFRRYAEVVPSAFFMVSKISFFSKVSTKAILDQNFPLQWLRKSLETLYNWNNEVYHNKNALVCQVVHNALDILPLKPWKL